MVEVQGKDNSSMGVPVEKAFSGCLVVLCEFEGLVFVRYLDHVLFSRCSPLTLKPQIREAVGWLNYECEQYIVVSWDRDSGPPTLKGGDPKASGLVLLKTDIQELKRLEPLQNNCYCHLNSATTNNNSEYAPKTNGRKTPNKGKQQEQFLCKQ